MLEMKPLQSAAAFQGLLPLEVRNLALEVAGRRLIDGVDLALHDRGFTTIMGPNGAGKSMLLRLMHGLVPPTKGMILWAGTPMSASIRRRQAMVFQRPVLFRRTAIGNIHACALATWCSGDERRRGRSSHRAGRARTSCPHACARPFSGEQQRLCLARALSLDPDVLFLDEPTASLDPASTLAIERSSGHETTRHKGNNGNP